MSLDTVDEPFASGYPRLVPYLRAAISVSHRVSDLNELSLIQTVPIPSIMLPSNRYSTRRQCRI